jgi:hypothetical protein
MKLHQRLSDAGSADVVTVLEAAYKKALKKGKIDVTPWSNGLAVAMDLKGVPHPGYFRLVASDNSKSLLYGIGCTWEGSPVYQSYSNHYLHKEPLGDPMLLHTGNSSVELIKKADEWHESFLRETPRYSLRWMSRTLGDEVCFYDTARRAVSGLNEVAPKFPDAEVLLMDNHTNSKVGELVWSCHAGQYKREGCALYSLPLQQAAQTLGIENKFTQAPAAKISI